MAEPNPRVRLSKAAHGAARALESWYRNREPEQKDLADLDTLLAEYLTPIATDVSSVVRTSTFRAIIATYQHWRGEEVQTHEEASSAIHSLRGRLATARANGSKIHPNETATLRNFCNYLSSIALENINL